MLSLDEYTQIAEKIITKSSQRFPYYKSIDRGELVREVIVSMVKSDKKVLDPDKSNLTREKLRRQDAIFAIKRFMYSFKQQRKKACIAQFNPDVLENITTKDESPIEVLIREEEHSIAEKKRCKAIGYVMDLPISRESKESLRMLLENNTLKDIAKKRKISKNKIERELIDSISVYKRLKGDLYES